MNMKPTGIKEITNAISLNGSYFINQSFELDGQLVFKYIMNSNHQKNKNNFGVEVNLAISYKIL